MPRAASTLFFLLAAFLGGCSGGGTRTVTLEVSRPDAAGTITPVANAYVRAIPVAASPVPLPINSATLEELSKLKNDADFTAADGRITLQISTIRPFLIEIAAPFSDTESTGAVWRASFDPVTGMLMPSRDDQSYHVRVLN